MQQTIVMPLDQLKFEVVDGIYSSTEYDDLVDDFTEGLLENYQMAVSKSHFVADGKMICVIEYGEMPPQVKRQYEDMKMSKLGLVRGGLKIPDDIS